MKKIIELEEGKLLDVFERLIDTDESTKELAVKAPLMIAGFAVMLFKIESELFKDDTDNNTLS